MPEQYTQDSFPGFLNDDTPSTEETSVLESNLVQESLPGFFDDEKPSDDLNVPLDFEKEQPQVSEVEHKSEFSNTQNFYESPNGLNIEHNPRSKNYLALLEKNPLGNVVGHENFVSIVRRQMNYVKVEGVDDAGHTLPLITAGEFNDDGSFIGLFRNRFRSVMPGGDGEIFRANWECHLIRTSKNGRIDVIKISLPQYGSHRLSKNTRFTKNNETKYEVDSELQRKIIEFEKDPKSMPPGTLHRLFEEITKKFE